MACETWGDHEWGGRRYVGVGRDRWRGQFHQYRIACGRCGREHVETEWVQDQAIGHVMQSDWGSDGRAALRCVPRVRVSREG